MTARRARTSQPQGSQLFKSPELPRFLKKKRER